MKLNEMNLELLENNIKVLKQAKENPNLIIQVSHIGIKDWKDRTSDIWERYYLYEHHYLYDYEYRIKPEPQYEPYKEIKEEWIGKKVKYKRGTAISIITGIERYMVYVGNFSHNLKCMFEEYIWGNNGDSNDGKPFGEVIE